jgi:Leucine-rich repeat (LRR) protein
LGGNRFSGQLPPLVRMPQLEELFLDNNLFTGSLSPIIALSAVKALHLQSNQLRGTLSGSFVNAMSRLTSLQLNNNQMDGSIPPDLRTHPTLREINLSFNKFSGNVVVPSSISGCILQVEEDTNCFVSV